MKHSKGSLFRSKFAYISSDCLCRLVKSVSRGKLGRYPYFQMTFLSERRMSWTVFSVFLGVSWDIKFPYSFSIPISLKHCLSTWLMVTSTKGPAAKHAFLSGKMIVNNLLEDAIKKIPQYFCWITSSHLYNICILIKVLPFSKKKSIWTHEEVVLKFL